MRHIASQTGGIAARVLIDRRQKVCKQMAQESTGAPIAETPCARRCARSPIRRPGKDIVSAGLVEGIEVRGGLVQVALLTDRAHAAKRWSRCARAVEALLARQPGVTNASAVLTAHKAQHGCARRRTGQAAMRMGTAHGAWRRSRRCCCRT